MAWLLHAETDKHTQAEMQKKGQEGAFQVIGANICGEAESRQKNKGASAQVSE
jgi:hypothetical protein